MNVIRMPFLMSFFIQAHSCSSYLYYLFCCKYRERTDRSIIRYIIIIINTFVKMGNFSYYISETMRLPLIGHFSSEEYENV